MARAATARQRLHRIAQAHSTSPTAPDSSSFGYCSECENWWPCPTYRWATDPQLTAADPFDDTQIREEP